MRPPRSAREPQEPYCDEFPEAPERILLVCKIRMLQVYIYIYIIKCMCIYIYIYIHMRMHMFYHIMFIILSY